MKKLRAAVAGVGYLGTYHAQKYKNCSEAELIGVFDGNIDQAQKVAENLQVKVFQKLEELVGQVDVVTVAVSTQSHFEIAEFLIKNGIHVNIEKPITSTVAQAEHLLRLAREKNVHLTVGHIERFNPAFVKWQEVKQKTKLLEFERLGPFKARGADVSVIHDLMIHDIDLLLSLNPGPIKTLRAAGDIHLSLTTDWAVVWIEFESGLRATLKASRVYPIPTRFMRAYENETHWTVYLNNGELQKVQFNGTKDDALVVETIPTGKVDALQVETDSFVHSVLHNKPQLVTGEDGLAALVLVERICNDLVHV